MEGSEGLLEGSEGLLEGSEGQPEGSEGLSEGSEGLPDSPLRDPSLPEIRQDETRPLITVRFGCRDDLCYSRPIAGNLMTASDGIRAQAVKFILTQASPIATFFDKVREIIQKNSLMNFGRSLLMGLWQLRDKGNLSSFHAGA